MDPTVPNTTPPVDALPPIPSPPPPVNAPMPSPAPVTNQPGLPPTAVVGYPRRFPTKKFLLFFVVIVTIVSTVSAAIYLMSRNQITPQATPSASPSVTKKADELAGFSGGIEIGEDTVQVTKADGKFCLQYKGRVYLPQQEGEYDPKEVFPEDPSVYTWYGLVDPPSDVSDSPTARNEVFGFKAFPDNSGFVFVMRWPKESGDRFEVFSFTQNGVSPISSFTPTPQELAYRVPKVYQISPGGNLAAMHMFDCWECEKHYPQTLLVNLVSKQTKTIGQTSYFAWRENGNYEYKDYFVNQDPSTLSLKTGQFSF